PERFWTDRLYASVRKGTAQTGWMKEESPAFKPVFYPHFTNGTEEHSECPEANGCKESQPFQMVRQPGGPSCARERRATQTCHLRPEGAHGHRRRRVRRRAGRSRPVSPAQLPPEPGALGRPARRRGSANLRTASGDTNPEPPHQAVHTLHLALLDATATF